MTNKVKPIPNTPFPYPIPTPVLIELWALGHRLRPRGLLGKKSRLLSADSCHPACLSSLLHLLSHFRQTNCPWKCSHFSYFAHEGVILTDPSITGERQVYPPLLIPTPPSFPTLVPSSPFPPLPPLLPLLFPSPLPPISFTDIFGNDTRFFSKEIYL